MSAPSIHIDLARIIDEVDPRIYSGFTEHMGRCIYGGIYDPDNQHGLVDLKTGFRTDVLEALKELNVPLVRYPGGNFVSSYRWQDGIGPKELRPRRPELAWLTEESNQFGTGTKFVWCRTLGTEPYICLNMGTGTLEDALAWVEYCNSSANTYWANLRRKNGHEEPYNVKYWSLGNIFDSLPSTNAHHQGLTGNEVWGPWQVGQMESQDYAKKAFQWAKALKLLDPSIKLISCGETGFSDWDRVTLKKLAPVVDFHSIHRTEGKHDVNVMGLRDMASELVSDLTQTTYYPLHLFANLMQGTSLDVFVSAPSPATFYTGPTVPKFVQHLTTHTPDTAKLTKYVDVSAVLSRDGREVRVAVLNRHGEEGFVVPIWFAGGAETVQEEVRVYEVWSQQLEDGNTFGDERVKTVERCVRFTGLYELKRHSFQGMVAEILF
ncbi:hypothetical protein C0992_008255 [Termitomyces sp. T32_za158]|nr:hypothetical protein C0992_008255 [Termitomyces sp. T32_za158]